MDVLRQIFLDPATRPFAIAVVSLDFLLLAFLVYKVVKWRGKEGYRDVRRNLYREYERVKENHETLLPQLRTYAVSTTGLKYTTGTAEDLQEIWREAQEWLKEIDVALERKPRRRISRLVAWWMEDVDVNSENGFMSRLNDSWLMGSGGLSDRFLDYPELPEDEMRSILRRLNAISATHDKIAERLEVAITPRKMGKGGKLETLDEFHNRMAKGKEAARRRESEFGEVMAKLDDAFDYVLKRHAPRSLEWEPPMTWGVQGLQVRHLFRYYHHNRRLAQHLRDEGEKADTTEEKEKVHREVVSLVSNAAENLKVHFEQQAKSIRKAWVDLEDIRERFSELSQEMETPLDLPEQLEEAEVLLVQEAPEMWREADAQALDTLLGRFFRRLNQARDRLEKLYNWKDNILSRGRLINRLEETRKELAETYEIPLKEVVGWSQAKYLFDEEVPTMWANLNQEGLNQAMDTLQKAINRQITVLSNAARGEIKLREDSGESGRSLDKLRSTWSWLESLPKEVTTSSSEPQQQASQQTWRPKVELSENAKTSPLGTRYDPELAPGFDQRSEEEDDEDEPQRPSTLEAIRQSQLSYSQRIHGKEGE